MSIAAPVSPGDRSRRLELVFALAAVALGLIFQFRAVWPGLQREAADRDEIFAAISIRALANDGLQVDYPTPILGRPWKLPAEFGLYHNLAAAASRLTGGGVESSARTVGLAFFYLSVPAVFLLARKFGASRAGSLLAVAFWLLSPFGCNQAGALTGTTTAVAFGAWWLCFFLESVTAPSLRAWLLCALFGAIAAPVGGPVFAPFALAGLLFWLAEQRRAARPTGPALSAIFGFLPAIVTAAAWTIHADHLKAANPFAASFRSAEFWSAAFGTWAQRWDSDFAVTGLSLIFGTLVAPLTILLAVVFAGFQRLTNTGAMARLGIVAFVCLVALLPLYDRSPAALGPLVLFAALAVAGLTGDILGGRTAAVVIGAALVLFAQSQLKIGSTEELRSPLPDAAGLAEAVSQATRPNDLVVTGGQDTDLLFAYRMNRRAILVPAGREADVTALSAALGSQRDWTVGAVVLTGRYRSEATIVADLRRLFNLAEKPLLQTSASDVYFPAASEGDVRNRLRATSHAAWLTPEPGAPPQSAPPPVPLHPPPIVPQNSLPPFTMMSPQPSRYSVPYDLVAHRIDGVPCFFAHAPTTLEFDLAAGGTQCALEFFMAEGSYTGKGDTDGADVVVSLHHANGNTEELFRRHLDPVNTRADRQRQTASVVFRGEPGSTLLVQSQPGPHQRANFDWVYFRRLEIK